MKARNIIGGAMAVAGLFVAVCCVDGSPHELLIRAAGAAMFAVGAWLGGWFGTKEADR